MRFLSNFNESVNRSGAPRGGFLKRGGVLNCLYGKVIGASDPEELVTLKLETVPEPSTSNVISQHVFIVTWVSPGLCNLPHYVLHVWSEISITT